MATEIYRADIKLKDFSYKEVFLAIKKIFSYKKLDYKKKKSIKDNKNKLNNQ